MASILDMVQQQLGSGGVQNIAQQLGTDPATTQTAIASALPMILGGMEQNTRQPGGAESLNSALDQHTGTLDALGGLFGGGGGGGMAAQGGGGGLGGLLGGVLGGGAGGGGGAMGGLGGLLAGGVGAKILGKVLGQKQPQVEQGIGRQTGMQPAQVGQLLMILAPIVMGVLAKRKQQEGLDAGRIGPVLQQDQQEVLQRDQQQGGMLGGLLGQVFGGGAGGSGGLLGGR